MIQKQSLNILCTIYQPFLEVYSFYLHVAVFHIRLTSFVFLTFFSLCEGSMFYNSLKNSSPSTSYVHSIYILCPEALCSALFYKSGQLNSQTDRYQFHSHIQKSILNQSSFSESFYVYNIVIHVYIKPFVVYMIIFPVLYGRILFKKCLLVSE